MAATIAQIRQAIADALDALDGVQASPYMLSNPTPPAAHVLPDEITYDQAMGRGLDRLSFKIQVYVGFTSDIGAQKRLDVFLAPSGASSVKALVEADRTLGGIVQDTHVTDVTGYRLYQAADAARIVLGAEWTVSVLNTGN